MVARGAARVRVGDTTRFLSEGEGVVIPKNVLHSLENCGRIELEVVAVQAGEYFGEGEGEGEK